MADLLCFKLGVTAVVSQPDVVARVSEQKCEAVFGTSYHLMEELAKVKLSSVLVN